MQGPQKSSRRPNCKVRGSIALVIWPKLEFPRVHSGLNLQTIRYYEQRGLLPKPLRTQSGYRIFQADAARRIRFIKRAQELGFLLDEIRELLSLRVDPRTLKVYPPL